MYFELEDVKRRHSAYWDLYNDNTWTSISDSTLSWNLKRGVFVGVTSHLIQECFTTFYQNFALLLTKYEPPASARQAFIFCREVLKMENYKQTLRVRSQYALTMGTFDMSIKIAAWRTANGGWLRPFGGIEYNFWRKLFPSLSVALLTAPINLPFEVAL